MTAEGLTVERGTAPEPFTAEIVGVLEDGIAPDVDMIIAETDSPAIQRAGGIWAGMSGSPVYAPDGRLIGAVAYGFSLAPSPVAGITPAEDMYQVLDRPAATSSTARTVSLPKALRTKLVRSGAATQAEADEGMQRLPTPLSVSGLRAERLEKFQERVAKKIPQARSFLTGASTGADSTPADIFPGSNFASALSYGDMTAAGVGTTTAVCEGNRALAFGHPFLFSGASTMSVHAADALLVQRDDTLGSFKLANPLGVVGALDQDRLAAIRGALGDGPPTTAVTSNVTDLSPGGSSRDGRTDITVRDFVPDLSAFHLLANLDRVTDRIGAGRSALTWKITGTRANGNPFSVQVSNRYASRFDISFEMIFDSYDQLFQLQENPFEAVKVTGVDYIAKASDEFKRYTLSDLRIKRPNGSLQAIPEDEPLTVVAGSRLNMRATLTPYQNDGATQTVDLSLAVPAGTAGEFGRVNVTGGPSFSEGPNSEPDSFDDLLAELENVTPNNSVNAELTVFTGGEGESSRKQTSDRELVDEVVVGEDSFEVRVVSPRRSLPAVVDGSTWKLRSSLSTGSPTRTFTFGSSTYRQVMGDWDGTGTTSPAVFKDGKWYVRMTPSSTSSVTFTFGQAGDIPVAGDWNGDGNTDVGVFRNGRWLLRNSLSTGPADAEFLYGASGTRPVVGDWNGDGVDSIGVFSNGQWRLRNDNTPGNPTYSFAYGTTGDKAVVGDWDRDGTDRPGLYRAGKWLYRNTLLSGSSTVFTYGGTYSRPLIWR